MVALSIRQPWAWLILHAGKDIENRDWPTRVRGRVLIHASKAMTRADYEGAVYFIDDRYNGVPGESLVPPFDDPRLRRGGIVGSVEIVDCVMESKSRWFVGRYGFVLRNPTPLQLRPYRGQLGFFPVADE